MIPASRRLGFVVFLFFPVLAGTSQSAGTADWNGLPKPGTRFRVRYSVHTCGTLTLNETDSFPFEQQTRLVFSALVLSGTESPDRLRIRYSYESARLELISGGESCSLEISPDTIILDGTPVFSRNRDPDLPASVLTHLLSEEPVLVADRRRKVIRFEEESVNRRKFSFLDLATPVRSTWISFPDPQMKIHQTWTETGPTSLLSGRIVIPATRTYRILSLPESATDSCRIGTTLSVRLDEPFSFPSRLGVLLPHHLKFDALGPDLFKPPPDTEISSFTAEGTGEIRYRPDLAFMEHRKMSVRIDAAFLGPRPDGQERDPRRLEMQTDIELRVEESPLPELAEEVRYLLFGG